MAHMDMANRLAIYGYKYELEDFDTLLALTWHRCFEDTYGTTEMLLHNPTKALELCDSIRRDAEVPEMPDNEILLRLTNLRKSGFLNACR